jgi:hypothetical protein
MLIIQTWIKWQQLSIHTVSFLFFQLWSQSVRLCIGYLDRYKNMKILQIQTSGDEFFIPDNEVKRLPKKKQNDYILFVLGCILDRLTNCDWWFILKTATQRWTFMCWSWNQSIFYNAKFLYECLWCKLVLQVLLNSSRSFKERTITFI